MTRQHPIIEDEFTAVVERWGHVVVVEQPCSVARIDQLVADTAVADLWTDPLRLLVVDYLGMIIPEKGRDLYQQVSEIAREVKNIAKRRDLATVLLCQVGRQGESGGTPVLLTGARDSGVVEEAADYILGLWRPELNRELKPDERARVAGQMMCAILKNRSGPAGDIAMFRWEIPSLRVSGGTVVLE